MFCWWKENSKIMFLHRTLITKHFSLLVTIYYNLLLYIKLIFSFRFSCLDVTRIQINLLLDLYKQESTKDRYKNR